MNCLFCVYDLINPLIYRLHGISLQLIHAHGAFLLNKEPLIDAVHVEVVVARSDQFDHVVLCEQLLAHDAYVSAQSS